jgi:RNA polymerase sigma factor (sigma-70 family)
MTTSHRRGRAASLHERALLSAARQGDRCAQDELLRRYEPLIRRTVAGLRLPCCCDRSDITQEAWLGLIAAIRAWQPTRGPFPAFAARCVSRKAFSALDGIGARKHQLLSHAVALDSASSPAAPGEAGSGFADPVATLLVREELDALLDALATLGAKERCLVAGAANDKSHQQLAGELGLTSRGVETALRRARRKLRGVLAA